MLGLFHAADYNLKSDKARQDDAIGQKTIGSLSALYYEGTTTTAVLASYRGAKKNV